MAPGTEEQPLARTGALGRRVLTQTGVIMQRAGFEQVVPSTHVQRGNGNAIVMGDDVAAAPVFTVVRMGQPILEVGRQPFELEQRQFHQRHMRERPPQPLHAVQDVLPFGFALFGGKRQAVQLTQGEILRGPRRDESKPERSALVYPSVVEIGGAYDRADCRQMRRSGNRGQQLTGADVRGAEHSDLFIAPGLPGAPFDGVIAVLDIAEERQEFAIRRESAAAVLNYDGVARFDRVKHVHGVQHRPTPRPRPVAPRAGAAGCPAAGARARSCSGSSRWSSAIRATWPRHSRWAWHWCATVTSIAAWRCSARRSKATPRAPSPGRPG